MSAPSISLWLPTVRSCHEALPWLESCCDVTPYGRTDDRRPGLAARLREPAAIGLAGLDGSRACGFWIEDEPDEFLEEYRQLGFPGLPRPAASAFSIYTIVSGRDNHLLVAGLAVHLADRYGEDALIDFGGVLGYHTSYAPLGEAEEEARLSQARALLAGLPGRLWEMPYRTTDGDWFSHVGDRAFLQGWMRHPDFRLF
ncbi:DUF6368 family protein [Streptacidiphilus melanogenes]|uniref:DUF6368 family protein n=1 Tax=Streptacidiphilus melanogenes TaxID=411235 RepID=UPI0005AA12E9|nr:DUF6368 family protein [Streptacidiphilus melanogenes]